MREKLRPLAALLLVLGMSLAMAACGDTWRGLREDTSENLDKASDAARP
jgi:hypothetical protein